MRDDRLRGRHRSPSVHRIALLLGMACGGCGGDGGFVDGSPETDMGMAPPDDQGLPDPDDFGRDSAIDSGFDAGPALVDQLFFVGLVDRRMVAHGILSREGEILVDGTVTLVSHPRRLRLLPGLRRLYVEHSGGFSWIELETLSEGGVRPFGAQPTDLVSSPDGTLLYVAASGAGEVRQLDPLVPVHSELGDISVGAGPAALALGSATLYVAEQAGDSIGVVELDSEGDFRLSRSVSTLPDTRPSGLALHPDRGAIYVLLGESDAVAHWSVDGAALTRIDSYGSLPSGVDESDSRATDLAIDPFGRFLYVTNEADASIAGFTIEADGSLTLIEHVSTVPGPASIEATRDGRFLLVASGEVEGRLQSFGVEAGGELVALDETDIRFPLGDIAFE